MKIFKLLILFILSFNLLLANTITEDKLEKFFSEEYTIPDGQEDCLPTCRLIREDDKYITHVQYFTGYLYLQE